MTRSTYSEHGEDILIHRLLLWKSNGFYVDAGAYHPFRMSMTARLRSCGWNGLNIDIDADAIALFQKIFPNAHNVCAAIGNDGEEAVLYKYADGVINTISEDQFKHLSSIADRGELFTQQVSTQTVSTRSISSCLRESGVGNRQVDFLNVDIEGVELTALMGFPWKDQKPSVVAVEIHQLNLRTCGDNEIVAFMQRVGYRLQSYVFHTAIFVLLEFDEEICHRHAFPDF